MAAQIPLTSPTGLVNSIGSPFEDDTTARRRRLTSFADRARQFPGVAGNGPTGVSDARGYSDLVNARRQEEDDLNAEEGKGPMAFRTAPLNEEHIGGSVGPAMRGLQMAMHGPNYAGGGDGNDREGDSDVDDNGAGQTARLANAIKQRDLESELLSPSSARPKLGQNLSDEELHSASANDFLQREAAHTAGQVYQMPEVAAMRADEMANKLAQIQRQYIDPARIKADADFATENMRGRAARDVADTTGNSRIAAAEVTREGVDQNAKVNALTGGQKFYSDLVPYMKDLPPETQKALQALLTTLMARQGVR